MILRKSGFCGIKSKVGHKTAIDHLFCCTATVVDIYFVVCVEFQLVKLIAFLAFWSARVGAPSPMFVCRRLGVRYLENLFCIWSTGVQPTINVQCNYMYYLFCVSVAFETKKLHIDASTQTSELTLM